MIFGTIILSKASSNKNLSPPYARARCTGFFHFGKSKIKKIEAENSEISEWPLFSYRFRKFLSRSGFFGSGQVCGPCRRDRGDWHAANRRRMPARAGETGNAAPDAVRDRDGQPVKPWKPRNLDEIKRRRNDVPPVILDRVRAGDHPGRPETVKP